jgi:hypothetical protein
MKKIKLILTSLAVFLLIASCENDGGDSKLELQNGAVPNVTKESTADAFIDLIAISNDEEINISFTVDVAQGDVASMDVVLFYLKPNAVYKATLEANITTFPKTYNLSQDDLINAFAELNSKDDFELGNQLIVTTELKLNNGTIIKIYNDNGTPNFGIDVANSPLFTVAQIYNVSCPSDLAGTYSVLTSGSSTDPGPDASVNPIANYPYTVTITANGGGDYTVSDAFGGVYILWYEMYGLDFEVPGKFSDVCGTISGVFPEPFGTNVTYSGSVDPDTGVITIDWINGYDDEGTSVFTKID